MLRTYGKFNKRNPDLDKSTWTNDERDLNSLDLALGLLQNSKDKSNLYGFNPLKTLLYELSLENIAKQISFRILRYSFTKKIASKRKEMFVSKCVIAKLSTKPL
jgi:hypothetical protein